MICTYRGELLESKPLTEDRWTKADNAAEKQIFELTNIIRDNYLINELSWDEKTGEVAYLHSLICLRRKLFPMTRKIWRPG